MSSELFLPKNHEKNYFFVDFVEFERNELGELEVMVVSYKDKHYRMYFNFYMDCYEGYITVEGKTVAGSIMA